MNKNKYQLIFSSQQYEFYSDANLRQVLKYDQYSHEKIEYRLPAEEFISFLDEVNTYHPSANQAAFLKKIDHDYLNMANQIIK
ncbi:hypothetical protein [Liquorilactobacillus vini]|uniref:hypothetical protein n=1 Tax=Liquorilactobacillus vini TaxID=238015 RepID=UPI00029A4612|nr:hypothetical protein [Liquorilactobacillus vini]